MQIWSWAYLSAGLAGLGHWLKLLNLWLGMPAALVILSTLAYIFGGSSLKRSEITTANILRGIIAPQIFFVRSSGPEIFYPKVFFRLPNRKYYQSMVFAVKDNSGLSLYCCYLSPVREKNFSGEGFYSEGLCNGSAPEKDGCTSHLYTLVFMSYLATSCLSCRPW